LNDGRHARLTGFLKVCRESFMQAAIALSGRQISWDFERLRGVDAEKANCARMSLS
jgi:hypothetical protein